MRSADPGDVRGGITIAKRLINVINDLISASVNEGGATAGRPVVGEQYYNKPEDLRGQVKNAPTEQPPRAPPQDIRGKQPEKEVKIKRGNQQGRRAGR